MPTPVYQLAFGEKQQFEDGNGNPRVGAKLFVYIAGTLTKATTYQETDGVATNTNPVILDGTGALPYGLYVESGTYDVVLAPSTDTDPPSSPIWSRPDLTPFNDTSLTLDEWVPANGTPTWTGAAAFTLTGDQTGSATPRRRVRIVDSGGTKYGTILTSVFGANTAITLAMDSGSLAAPIVSVEYGLLTSVNSAIPWLSDDQFNIADPADASKRGGFDVGSIGTGQRRIGTFPNYNFRMGNLVAGIGPLPYCGRAIPTGWLDCNQAAVSRTTYADLFEAIVPLVGTFTVTIASPGVFTLNGHGFAAGNPVYLTTTGALPTGLSANTIYYVASAGLTANDFQLSLVPGGASINTSGTQSGTHSIRYCPFGLGDGSSTFDLPKTADRGVIGEGSGTAFETLTNAAINTGTDSVTVQQNTDRWQTGMLITWGVTGTPPTTSPANLLDNADTVYVIRVDATTVRFATTLANAQNGVVIDITAAGSGTFTMTKAFSARQAGQTGGDDEKAMSSTELLSHFHGTSINNPGPSPITSVAGSGAAPTQNTNSTGGNAAMSVRNPYLVTKMIISY